MRLSTNRILYFLSGTALGLIFVEVAIRLALFLGLILPIHTPNNDHFHQYAIDNHDLLYEIAPSKSTSWQGRAYNSNSWGMRDVEYELKKEEGVYRIAVIGDSVAFGAELESDNQSFIKQIQTQINKDLEQKPDSQFKKVEVMDFSVIGYNSAQEEIVLKDKVLKFSPDLVVIAFCQNDATLTDGLQNLPAASAPWAIGQKLKLKSIEFAQFAIERLIFSLKTDENQIYSLLDSLKNLQRQNRFTTLFVNIPTLHQNSETYPYKDRQLKLKELSQMNHLGYIDLMDSWQAFDYSYRFKMYAVNDDVHLSPLGMTEVSKILSPVIEDLMQQPYHIICSQVQGANCQ